MKNIGMSRLRSECVRKLSKIDVDYELPIMMLVVVATVVLMLTVSI